MTENTVPTPETPKVVEAVAAPVTKAAKKTATTAKKTVKKTTTTAKKTAAKTTTTARKTAAKTTTTAKKTAAKATKPISAKAPESPRLLEVPVTRVRSLLAEFPEPAAVKSRVEGEILVASKAVEDFVAPRVTEIRERAEKAAADVRKAVGL